MGSKSEQSSKWNKANPEKHAAYKKKYAESINGRANSLLHSVRYRCRKKQLECNLTREWIEDRLRKPCPKTGWDFDLCLGSGSSPKGPSIDKINPKLGYTTENSQVVCWMYNAAKGSWTGDDVLEFAKALLNVNPIP